MPMSPDDWAWFAARVRLAVLDINTEYRMAVQVKALAEIVRDAKAAIDSAGYAASRLRDSATAVVDKINQVDDMRRELDTANADLTAALGGLTNGGPSGPLPDTVNSSVASPGETIESSIAKVQTLNLGANS